MKKYISLILSIAIMLSVVAIPVNAEESKNADEIHVLMLGTFHTRFMQYDLGQSLSQIGSLMGKKIVATAFSDPQGGMNQLDVIWNNYGKRIKGMFNNEYYDYVILENWLYSESNDDPADVQQQDYEDYRTYAKKWADFARSKGSQPILYIPQMWQRGYRLNLSEDDLNAYVDKHMAVAEELEIPAINAAKAWFDYDSKGMADWTASGKDEIFYSSILYAERWHHNYIGGAFTAMLMYEMLYNEKVENLPFSKLDNTFMSIAETNNRYLKMSKEEKEAAINLMYEKAYDAYNWYSPESGINVFPINYVTNPANKYTITAKGKKVKNVYGKYNDDVSDYILAVKPVMKKLGYKYGYKKKNKKIKTVTFKRKKQVITLTVGSKKFTVNKKKYKLPASVKIKENNVVVPLKSFLKKIGYKTFKVTDIKGKKITIK